MNAAFDMVSMLKHEFSDIAQTVAVVHDMKELGEEAARYHMEAGAQARRLGIDTLLVGGEFTAAWQKGFGKNALSYQSVEEIPALLDALVENASDHSLVLFKASHSTGLHTIASRYAASARIEV
jgi:UDP-N-acetylmuramoyl-tripeptide--D-alanyl-D-alanine ligase